MSMNCRYFPRHELDRLFSRNILSDDIENEYVVGVSEVCDFSSIVESKKIEGIHENTLKASYANVKNKVDQGNIWILELTSDNLSRLLLEDDFYETYCDKKGNPYTLVQRISLHFDSSYSYWTENVYAEAFDL